MRTLPLESFNSSQNPALAIDPVELTTIVLLPTIICTGVFVNTPEDVGVIILLFIRKVPELRMLPNRVPVKAPFPLQ
jgi:hypothetical protein